MRFLFIIITIGILFSCSTTKTVTNVSDKYTFKSIYVATYSAKKSGLLSRENALKLKGNRKEIYNKNGVLTEYWKYNSDQTIREITKLDKDENGKLLKRTTYDDAGNLKFYYNPEYDNNGNMIFYRTYSSNNKLKSIKENKFDSHGNITSRSTTNLIPNTTTKTTSEYNAENQLIKETNYNQDGTVRHIRVFKYDENGNKIESELTRSSGEYTKYVYSYNELKYITSTFGYDKEGNQTYWNNWEYTFDKYDNWVTKKRFLNGEIDYVRERKIEYY